MKAFHCDFCGSLVFFENVSCIQCGHQLGYLPVIGDISALASAGDGTWRALTPGARDRLYRQCANGSQNQICNWMVPVEDPAQFCVSCRLNAVIPDLSVTGNPDRWRKLEMAKRRLIYTLLQLGLPTEGVPESNRPPLRFSFLGDRPGGQPVLSGHLNGMITVNIAEADDDVRERRRVSLHEPYRTLLGHFRHESAHYYWERLILNGPRLARFRELFGDETIDYEDALKAHYQQGAPPDWQSRFVTEYASSHPWEDWAETWAHYLHIIDTVETAGSFGISLKPRHPAAQAMTADPKTVSGPGTSFDRLLAAWFPLTYALNALNRGMGLHDLYPFVLSSPVIEKLGFVHEVVHDTRLIRNAAC